MIQITRKAAISKLVESDVESIMSGDRVGRQMLIEILKTGSSEYTMLEDDELLDALQGAFDEDYEISEA